MDSIDSNLLIAVIIYAIILGLHGITASIRFTKTSLQSYLILLLGVNLLIISDALLAM